MTEETLFHQALAKSPAERAAFLDEACAGQPELYAAVEALLAAHEASGDLLDRPAAELGQTVDSDPGEARPVGAGEFSPEPDDGPPPHPRPLSPGGARGDLSVTTTDYQPKIEPGAVIAGRYTLIEKIGEGGMGEVWVGKQTEPVKRKVALKLIKTGMDSKAVLARFEQERQALAMMDHPNIARVLDGGMTPTGQPFFVMELVNGLPLTKFCDESKLTPKDRLELFVPICHAIQHAHQKGIVHRDLKPANILVTLIDGKPVPKVIDFGVAKATAGRLIDESLSTQFGAVVGTLEYMAPEQAGFAGVDVDTRADIYSLGVILYELLTGLRPIDVKRLKRAALTEMVRIIQEEEPSKPSTRLSTDESLPSLAAVRQTEPKKLMAMLRGELDWVVMKCLEKQRDRRYETANALSRDIQRYLADEAVEARPPSAGYLLRKFARKHRTALATAALFVVLLVVGAAVSIWQAVRATRAEADAIAARDAEAQERAKAESERDEKEKARAAEAEQRRLADDARKKAADEAAVAKAVNDFLQNDLLAEANPEKNPRKKQVTVEEVLGRAAARIDGKFGGQPLVEAAIRSTIGVTYRLLGKPDIAVPHLERSLEIRRRILGPEQADTLWAMTNLATAYKYAGQFDRALALKIKALEISRRLLGEEHPLTLTAIQNLASQYSEQGQHDKAEPLQLQSLELNRRVMGEDHADTYAAMNNLAGHYLDIGQYKKAEPLLIKVSEGLRRVLGDDHPRTLQTIGNLGRVYEQLGQYAKAEPLYVKALEGQMRALEEEHEETVRCMNNLAHLYRLRSQFAKAEPLLVKALEISRRTLGEEHPKTLVYANNLGGLYRAVGQFAKAEPILIKTLEAQSRILGEEHSATLATMGNLGLLYKTQNQFAKAEPLYLKRLEIGRRVHGEEHPDTILAMNLLGRLYSEVAQEYGKAEPLLCRALDLRRRVLGNEHPDTIESMHHLAFLLFSMRQFDGSILLTTEKLGLQKIKLGIDHPETIRTAFNLGAGYREAGRLDDAVALFDEWLPRAKAVLPPNHPALGYGWPQALQTYERAGRHGKVEPFLRELLANTRKEFGEKTLAVAGALAMLGINLLQQKKYADAEPVLREGLTIREKLEPNAWTTFNAKWTLGGALMEQKKYAEAEPLLLAGYEGMKKREDKIPNAVKPRLIEALGTLVQLYDALGKKGDADKWRKELGAIKAAQKKPEKQP
jgi:tetratricopeptide (TPR) repeat protein